LILAPAFERAGYVVRRPLRAGTVGDPRLPAPTAEEIASSVLLFEQVDRERFPGLGDLPKDCGVVRFPSLDTNLLWPVEQRVLAQCVAQGWDEDVVVDYYLTRYGDFRVDLARLATLETARLRARRVRGPRMRACSSDSAVVPPVTGRRLFTPAT